MTIRHVDKRGKSIIQPGMVGNNRSPASLSEEIFARQLAAQQRVDVAGTSDTEEVAPIQGVPFDPGASTQDAGRYYRREQMERTEILLETLSALGRDIAQSVAGEESAETMRGKLREARDHALRTLSGFPERGEERELLHRTTVLATVELAKTDRGDYK